MRRCQDCEFSASSNHADDRVKCQWVTRNSNKRPPFVDDAMVPAGVAEICDTFNARGAGIYGNRPSPFRRGAR